MAAADIVFEDADGHMHVLLVDAVISETHRAAAIATEDVVEEGADITDHYREERAPLDLVVSITDSPHRAIPAPEGANVTAYPVAGSVESVDLEFHEGPVLDQLADGGEPHGVETKRGTAPTIQAQIWTPESQELTRTFDSWALLVAATQSAPGWRATITTRTRTYESMLLVSAEAIRTAEKGSILECALVFMPLRTQSTARTEVAPEAPLRPRNQAGTDEGNQPTGEAEAPSESLLHQVFG